MLNETSDCNLGEPSSMIEIVFTLAVFGGVAWLASKMDTRNLGPVAVLVEFRSSILNVSSLRLTLKKLVLVTFMPGNDDMGSTALHVDPEPSTLSASESRARRLSSLAKKLPALLAAEGWSGPDLKVLEAWKVSARIKMGVLKAIPLSQNRKRSPAAAAPRPKPMRRYLEGSGRRRGERCASTHHEKKIRKLCRILYLFCCPEEEMKR